MPSPLQGIRVIDFTRLLPGPYCTLLLADLGAEVIKIEDIRSGDYMRTMPPQAAGMNVGFAWLNRGKRSIRLDLRRAGGVEAARRLISTSDVLIESFRPGVMRAMGLDAAALASDCPRLVYCSLSGYGQDGPMKTRAGHDIDYLARSGLASVTGTLDGSPVLPGTQLADIGSALYACCAILTALLARERGTAAGQHVDISITEAAVGLLTMHAAVALFHKRQPPYGKGLLWGRIPAYRFYRCADGGSVAVGALEPKFWERLCHALDLDDLAGDGLARGARAEEVSQRVQARFLEHSRDEWADRLSAEDCCVEPVLDINEAFRSDLALARGWAVEVTIGGERLMQPSCPLRLSITPAVAARPAAAAGVDTHQLLSDVGYTDEELSRMQADGLFG